MSSICRELAYKRSTQAVLFVTMSDNSKASFIGISKIIEDKAYDGKLREWAGDYKWKLLYRASENGPTSKAFHQCCDLKGPTLVVIKSTDGMIFGGFTTQSWSGYSICSAVFNKS